MNDWSVIIPMTPKAQTRPRFTRRGGFVETYEAEETRQWKVECAKYVRSRMKGECHRYNRPVIVDFTFFFSPPKSWTKKKRDEALRGMILKDSKPDIDNLVKCVMDALNGVLWEDDRLIVKITATKRYSQEDAVRIDVGNVG